MIGALCVIGKPAVGRCDNETDEALREACGAFAGWPAATVLHGESVEIAGVTLFGLGAGIPRTRWQWSFDLSEAEAEVKLAACPVGVVLVVHSPPRGHLGGTHRHFGSTAILRRLRVRALVWRCVATSMSAADRGRGSAPHASSISDRARR